MAGLFGGILNILLSFALPIVMVAYLMMKRPSTVLPTFFGAITFTVFQLILCTPLLEHWLQKTSWHQTMLAVSPFGLYLLYAMITALFAEGSRFLVMQFLMKRNRRFIDGLAFGVGYGSVETVLVTGVGTIATMFLLGGVQNGWNAVFAGIEGVSMLMLHVVWSVLTLKTVVSRKLWMVLLAFLSHVFVEFAVTVVKEREILPLWSLELLLLALSVVAVIFVFKLRKNWRNR